MCIRDSSVTVSVCLWSACICLHLSDCLSLACLSLLLYQSVYGKHASVCIVSLLLYQSVCGQHASVCIVLTLSSLSLTLWLSGWLYKYDISHVYRVNYDFGFEDKMAELGCEVLSFDPR